LSKSFVFFQEPEVDKRTSKALFFIILIVTVLLIGIYINQNNLFPSTGNVEAGRVASFASAFLFMGLTGLILYLIYLANPNNGLVRVMGLGTPRNVIISIIVGTVLAFLLVTVLKVSILIPPTLAVQSSGLLLGTELASLFFILGVAVIIETFFISHILIPTISHLFHNDVVGLIIGGLTASFIHVTVYGGVFSLLLSAFIFFVLMYVIGTKQLTNSAGGGYAIHFVNNWIALTRGV